MRSYGLGLGFVAIWAATYAVQNQDILAVRFLAWDFALSQGLWEIFFVFLRYRRDVADFAGRFMGRPVPQPS